MSLRGGNADAAIHSLKQPRPMDCFAVARNDEMVNLYETLMDSPLGQLHLIANNQGLCAIRFGAEHYNHPAMQAQVVQSATQPVLHKTQKQLGEYFAGKRELFDLPLALRGTVFQIKSWRALQRIPYGQTRSYGEQAVMVGDKNKARAVGMANNRNPIPIIIPCHRIIGADGKMVGYAGGITRKELLLKLEGANILQDTHKLASQKF